MPTKLEERATEAMETIAEAVQTISEATKAIHESQRQLNDNFLLHHGESKADHKMLCDVTNGVKDEVHGIRDDFKATIYPLLKSQSATITRILKWTAAALIVLAGGAEGLKILGVL